MWLCVCAASAVGSPVANINTIGIVHIVLMSIYNLTNTCINLKGQCGLIRELVDDIHIDGLTNYLLRIFILLL